jgi:hypothetical protein
LLERRDATQAFAVAALPVYLHSQLSRERGIPSDEKKAASPNAAGVLGRSSPVSNADAERVCD